MILKLTGLDFIRTTVVPGYFSVPFVPGERSNFADVHSKTSMNSGTSYVNGIYYLTTKLDTVDVILSYCTIGAVPHLYTT